MPLSQCWKFFGDFANIDRWDPNVKSSKLVEAKQGPNKIGQIYRLTTIFKQKQSQIDYVLKQYKQQSKIYLRGQNDTITADDQIQFISNGQKSTIVKYTAEIKLKGILWLFTPFIVSDLKTLERQAMDGMKKKAQELAI